jgi:hypothetical protein
MWLCRFRVWQVAFLTILSTRYSQNNDIYYFPLVFSINFVTFIQAGILETGPGGNLHVAVPGPDPPSNILKQYYPHGIPKIMISTIFRHSLSILLFLFKPEFFKPDPVVISMWLCRFRIRKVAFLNNIIYTVFPKL